MFVDFGWILIDIERFLMDFGWLFKNFRWKWMDFGWILNGFLMFDGFWMDLDGFRMGSDRI